MFWKYFSDLYTVISAGILAWFLAGLPFYAIYKFVQAVRKKMKETKS